MIEKAHFKIFEKKITAYIDGSLSVDDRNEFEAFVLTHPEFESQIKLKQNEIELIRSMMPSAQASKSSLESLDNEIRTSVFNLLREEPQTFRDFIALKWEDLLNR